MGFWSKLVILTLAVLAFCYVKVNFFDTPNLKVEKKLVAEEQVIEPQQKTTPKSQTTDKKETAAAKEQQKPQKVVTVYFLGMDKNNNSIFKTVKREVPSKEEFLEKNMLGFGNKHKKVDDFIGNYISLSIRGASFKLGTYISKEKPEKKSAHCGLSCEEMEVPLIIIQ